MQDKTRAYAASRAAIDLYVIFCRNWYLDQAQMSKDQAQVSKGKSESESSSTTPAGTFRRVGVLSTMWALLCA